jgi:hypothetical protein
VRNVARFHTGSDVVAWLRLQLWGSDHGLDGGETWRPRTNRWICPNPKLGSWTITHVSAYWRKDSVQWSSRIRPRIPAFCMALSLISGSKKLPHFVNRSWGSTAQA